MKKCLILFLVLMVLVSGIFASGRKETQTIIRFPTAGTSGALYSIGAAIANLWNTKIPEVSASSQASAGGIDNLNQIADGESQVSIAISSNCWQSYNGTGPFENYANTKLRVIAGLYFNPNQVVVTKRSGINTLTDIKGKRFAVAAAGSSVEGECRSHFTAAGLKYPDDIKAEYLAFSDSSELLRSGQLDGAWIMSGVPAAAVNEALASKCRLLSIDDDIIEKLQEEFPWYVSYTIPANTYPNQSEDVQTTAIKMVMFCSSDLDDEVVYKLTKVFWENIKELESSQSSLKGLTPEAAVQDIAGLPIHEGAIKYYQEIGVL